MTGGTIFAIILGCLIPAVFIAICISASKMCKHKWKTLGTTPIKFKTHTFGFVSGHNGEVILEQCEICKEKHAYATDGMDENWDVGFGFANRNYFSGKIKELS